MKLGTFRRAPVTDTLAQVREKSLIFSHTRVMFAPVTNALDTLLTYVAVQGYLALHRYIHWVWRRKLDLEIFPRSWKSLEIFPKTWENFQDSSKFSQKSLEIFTSFWKFFQKSTKNTNLGIFPGKFFFPSQSLGKFFFQGIFFPAP